MYINKNFDLKNFIHFSGGHLLWISLWSILVTVIYELTHWEWMDVPWLPVSIIGTAVAFYIGFKNNQAYDRLWEARKIWGSIVNSSRAWGSVVKAFISNYFNESPLSEEELDEIKRKLVFRHIGWLYALRSQLLLPTSWEHISQGSLVRKSTERRMKRFGIGLLDDDVTMDNLICFLPQSEYDELINYKNTATQIIDKQSQDLKSLRERNLIEDFRHMEMQNILNDFYVHQGKCERIKKFPLPRQYGAMSLIFVGIFIFLIPFTFVSEFHDINKFGAWLSIPFSILVSWIFLMMELIGDYSENPFEGLGNDIPMLALCRTIEIDLKEMIGEDIIPNPIEPVRGVLM